MRVFSIIVLATIMSLSFVSSSHAAAPKLLKQGDVGFAVKQLQVKLTRLGYLPLGHDDGTYGAATAQGVMAFQGWARLERDGIFGPQSRRALRNAQRPVASRRETGRRIEVHLDRQVALLVGGDNRVQRAVHISSAAPGYATPRGRWKVFRKERMSWSNPYKVWLPWASYFVGGVAFHEYASVPGYAASHGCVRVPAHEAQILYRFARYGTSVIVR